MNRLKIWFFEKSPRWIYAPVSSFFWNIHPSREKVNMDYEDGVWKVEHEDCELLVPARKIVQSLSINRPWENYLEIEEGEVCLDVGSTIGEDSIHMASKVGRSGEVYSVEAFPSNFELLQKNIRNNNIDNITARNYAAWSEKDILTFHEAERPTDGSIFEDHHPDGVKTGRKIEVRANPLDVLVDVSVDFMKMNIEGAELEALKGAEKTLNKCKKVFLTTDHLVGNSFTTTRVIQILEDYGFNAQLVEPKEKRYVVARRE